MNLNRSLILLLLIPVVSVSAQAQGRRERLPLPRDPQFYQPRNKLADFDGRVETLLIRGRHVVGTIRAQNGFARVEATEIRDSVTGETVSGAVVTMVANGGPTEDIRSIIC